MGPGETFSSIAFFMAVGLFLITRGEMGRAIAQRIRGRQDDDLRLELDQLRGEVAELRHELSDTQERLDFAERLLAQGRVPDQLSERR